LLASLTSFFRNLQRIINKNIHLGYVCIYFLIRNSFVCLLASSLKSKMLVNGAIITLMLRLFSVLFSVPSQVAELEFRVGPDYFRAGGLRGHASQHPIDIHLGYVCIYFLI
jgi:sugar phosphate permease